MRFFRQEYLSGLPCPPPGGLPNLGIKPASLMSNVHLRGEGGSLSLAPPGKPTHQETKTEKKKRTSIGVDLKNLEPHTLLVGM